MEEAALSSRLSTQEKLLVAQAVYKYGAVDWQKISALLENHPVVVSQERPKEWFDVPTVEAYYVGLMTEIGINVPAQDASKPQAKVHLRLAQTFYLARLEELKSSIAEYEQKFSTLMTEITAIKSGSMDKSLKDEMRAVLARKFGKKLLDSWVPDEDAIKQALEAGSPTEEEIQQAQVKDVGAERAVQEGEPEKVVLTAGATSSNQPETEDDSVTPKAADESQAMVPDAETQPTVDKDDVDMEDGPAPRDGLSPVKGRVATPAPDAQASSSSPIDNTGKTSAPSSPASDLSSAPEDTDRPSSPIKAKGRKGKEDSGRLGKRKASTQHREAPSSKRSSRRRTTATPALEAGDEAAEEKGEASATEDMDLVVEAGNGVDSPAPVEDDEPPKRGRRQSKRDSFALASRSKKATSPASSTRHSSPIQPRRGVSVSSAQSGTPAAEERRTSRRGPKGRGMRDDVVSKSVREQSAAVESVKEDEGEEDEAEAEPETKGPTRSSRRGTKGHMTPREDSAVVESAKEEEADEEEPAPTRSRTSRRSKGNATPRVETPDPAKDSDAEDEEKEQDDEDEEDEEEERRPARSSRRAKDNTTPIPDKSKEVATERKSTRRSIAKGGAGEAEDEKPEIAEETPRDKRGPKRPRQSSPRETKAVQKMLNSLLDQISGHRNGNIFLQPVRKSEAPDYYNVIKRPMDLKTVRARIRDGTITTLDEFERDIMLIFANATMYNSRGSQLYDMAMEMMKDAEGHIAHLKSVQHHMGR